MDYRYFAWVENEIWGCNKLLPMRSIFSQLKILDWKYEVHCSIQTYDKYGNCLSCPIYLDFDNDYQMLAVRSFVSSLYRTTGYHPKIYFSGGKGFHVIIPHIIEHPQCHNIVGWMVKTLMGTLSFDHQIYKIRSMLRIPGSPHSSGKYKIPITYEETMNLSFEEISNIATARREELPSDNIEKFSTNSFFMSIIQDAYKLGPISYSKEYNIRECLEFYVDMMPCIKKMLETAPDVGERNHTIHILARYIRKCDIDLDSGIAVMLQHDHYKKLQREVISVFRSVYKSSKEPLIGCKRGRDKDLMGKYCDKWCKFNENFGSSKKESVVTPSVVLPSKSTKQTESDETRNLHTNKESRRIIFQPTGCDSTGVHLPTYYSGHICLF